MSKVRCLLEKVRRFLVSAGPVAIVVEGWTLFMGGSALPTTVRAVYLFVATFLIVWLTIWTIARGVKLAVWSHAQKSFDVVMFAKFLGVMALLLVVIAAVVDRSVAGPWRTHLLGSVLPFLPQGNLFAVSDSFVWTFVIVAMLTIIALTVNKAMERFAAWKMVLLQRREELVQLAQQRAQSSAASEESGAKVRRSQPPRDTFDEEDTPGGDVGELLKRFQTFGVDASVN